ncbi:ankyrin repeat domain-containing protein [Candidatus Cardinium hertigii]|uniref:ankyrin repeat domain-containing protein n=1 Tax=Candidatus Cardinium hertigii TaxID=247481 RepID=UPI003D7DFB42
MNEKKEDGCTPLHIAASLNRVDIVNALLTSDAEVNEKNKNGETALDLAKAKNHSECITLLEQMMRNKP